MVTNNQFAANQNSINLRIAAQQEVIKTKIIGITGSNGKTTTKELLYSILSKKYKCSKNQGNYNSLIGLPLSFLNSNIDDEICILEYGANRPKEISFLCKIIKE